MMVASVFCVIVNFIIIRSLVVKMYRYSVMVWNFSDLMKNIMMCENFRLLRSWRVVLFTWVSGESKSILLRNIWLPLVWCLSKHRAGDVVNKTKINGLIKKVHLSWFEIKALPWWSLPPLLSEWREVTGGWSNSPRRWNLHHLVLELGPEQTSSKIQQSQMLSSHLALTVASSH